jgi:hypothetical protein
MVLYPHSLNDFDVVNVYKIYMGYYPKYVITIVKVKNHFSGLY